MFYWFCRVVRDPMRAAGVFRVSSVVLPPSSYNTGHPVLPDYHIGLPYTEWPLGRAVIYGFAPCPIWSSQYFQPVLHLPPGTHSFMLFRKIGKNSGFYALCSVYRPERSVKMSRVGYTLSFINLQEHSAERAMYWMLSSWTSVRYLLHHPCRKVVNWVGSFLLSTSETVRRVSRCWLGGLGCQILGATREYYRALAFPYMLKTSLKPYTPPLCALVCLRTSHFIKKI